MYYIKDTKALQIEGLCIATSLVYKITYGMQSI